MCVRTRRYYDATMISLRQKLGDVGRSLHDMQSVVSDSQSEYQLHDLVSQQMTFCAADVTVLPAYHQMRWRSVAAGSS